MQTFTPFTTAASTPSSHTLIPTPIALNSVLYVTLWYSRPDSSMPWRIEEFNNISVTGFILRPNIIMTCATNLRYATMIRVRKKGEERSFTATLLSVDTEWNVGLLTVKTKSFWNGIEPLEIGEGEENDEGRLYVVDAGKKWAVKEYAGFTREQKLMSCGGGASMFSVITLGVLFEGVVIGGPVFNAKSELVGLVLGNSKEDENGKIASSRFVTHFLKGFEKLGRCPKALGLGFEWQRLTNDIALTKYLGIEDNGMGILVTVVYMDGGAFGVLKEGDVLYKINGVIVNENGTVPHLDENWPLEFAISDKFEEDVLQVDVIRHGEVKRVEYALQNQDMGRLIPFAETERNPEYVIVAGLVFVAVSRAYLEDAFGKDWLDRAPSQLVYLAMNGRKSEHGEQVIVVSRCMEAEINVAHTEDLYWDLPLKGFNGIKVRNLAHLAALVENCDREYYRFTMERNVVMVFNRHEALESMASILAQHSISGASYISEKSEKSLKKVINENETEVLESISK